MLTSRQFVVIIANHVTFTLTNNPEYVPCKFEGTNVCVQGVSGVSATYAPRTIIEALKRVA